MANVRQCTLATCALSWFLCASIVPEASAAKILSVAFISSKSHKITYEPLLYELAARGHEVTIVAPYISGKTRPNVREIQTSEWNESKMGNVFDRKLRGEQLMNPFIVLDMILETCSATFDMPHVRQLLDEKFDLIFSSALINDCTMGFIHKLNTSLIIISPVSAPNSVARVFGNPSPTSFVPHLLTPYEDQMTFWERTVNFLVDSLFNTVMFLYFQPAAAEL